MRPAISLFLVGSLAFAACAGETSSLMSVYNDSGVGGQGMASGGAAGHPTGGNGGGTWGTLFNTGGTAGTFYGGAGGAMGGRGGAIGGQGGSAGPISVPGGARDPDTGRCIATTGSACPTSPDSIACAHGHCEGTLLECFTPTGAGSFVGQCANYGNCMFACPCDSRKTACENACLQNYASADPDCSTCLLNLGFCMGLFGCSLTEDCTTGTSGGSAGSAGPVGPVAGQAGNFGAGGAIGGAIGGAAGGLGGVGGTRIVLPDAGPVPADAGPAGVTVDARAMIDARPSMDLRSRSADLGRGIVISLDARGLPPILP
jgi:hypothetical protein